MPKDWEITLERWRQAALVNDETAGRIRAFEARNTKDGGLRWPVLVALIFGGLLLCAGMLILVTAYWEELSPSGRFSLILLLVALFHVAGAFTASRFRNMSITFHAIGTVVLGPGIFLAAEIFYLREHWPSAFLLWAVGAWIGWLLLRHWTQLMLAAIVMPIWLAGEWIVRTAEYNPKSAPIMMGGVMLLVIAYLGSLSKDKESTFRVALAFIGGVLLIPAAFAVVRVSHEAARSDSPDLPFGLSIAGWLASLGLPLVVAFLLRRRAAWIMALYLVWVVILGWVSHDLDSPLIFMWCAAGAVATVAWGVWEDRAERINIGIAGFALAVVLFSYSNLMDKLGRAASLITLGVLFMAGGWILERTRRRLVARAKGE